MLARAMRGGNPVFFFTFFWRVPSWGEDDEESNIASAAATKTAPVKPVTQKARGDFSICTEEFIYVSTYNTAICEHMQYCQMRAHTTLLYASAYLRQQCRM